MKKILTILLLAVLSCTFSVHVFAEEGTGKAYTYDHNFTAVAVPDLYMTDVVLYGDNAGFNMPADFVYHDGELYILNTSGNAVTVLDEEYNFVKNINLYKNGKEYTLSKPESIWIDNDGTMLFADSGKKLVIRTNKNGNVIGEYSGPDNAASEGTEFSPYKVLTDYLGRIYVLSSGKYRGIIQMDSEGEFMTYFGSKSITATASVLIDMAWRKLMSKEQIANSARYLPTEYSNMTIDQNGFLFVSSGSSSDASKYIVKLNSNGSNVLEGSSFGDYNLKQQLGMYAEVDHT